MFNGADYIIFGVVAISSVIGLWRGLVKEVFSLLNWLVALGFAYLFYKPIGALLPIGDSDSAPWLRDTIAGALVFFGTLIGGGIIRALIDRLVKATGLSGTDRTLGMIFGIGRGVVVILSLLLVLPSLTPIAEQTWWAESRVIPVFLSFEESARGLYAQLTALFQSVFQRG